MCLSVDFLCKRFREGITILWLFMSVNFNKENETIYLMFTFSKIIILCVYKPALKWSKWSISQNVFILNIFYLNHLLGNMSFHYNIGETKVIIKIKDKASLPGATCFLPISLSELIRKETNPHLSQKLLSHWLIREEKATFGGKYKFTSKTKRSQLLSFNSFGRKMLQLKQEWFRLFLFFQRCFVRQWKIKQFLKFH